MTASRVRPVRELADFRKITLDPGTEAKVSFEINEEMLRFWTAEGKWESDPGSPHNLSVNQGDQFCCV
ncbi:MAG: fibronectin type III-like domain-contianing protein [Lachnospiraceae bacterium]|nr:fibronectin type III-like domain-contianing protein [Lachnospiraceae bacterium]